ncbi:MAG: IS66 family insertion sequence element accessory protein TnpB [Acidimicrobiales bacterium]
MIQITPQMRVLVAIEAVDGRRGIDGLGQVCRSVLLANPGDGTLFVFRTRSGKAIRLLVYDGQGFWLASKRLSTGRFRYWPRGTGAVSRELLAHEFSALIWGGDPQRAQAAPMWRRIALEPPAARPS